MSEIASVERSSMQDFIAGHPALWNEDIGISAGRSAET